MRRVSTRTLLVTGVLVALLLAGVVSRFASTRPDGLGRVASDQGFAATERAHPGRAGPLAGYGGDGGRVSRGVAGAAGSLVVLVLAGGLALAVRRRPDRG